MNDLVRQVLTEMAEWGKAHDAGEAEHGRRMLNLEADTALLISIMIRSGARTRLLEIGTSNGYSTIWLAASTDPGSGHVISVDHSAEKQVLADANLTRAGLRERVTLRHGDARQVVEELNGQFDLVFLDADRRQYPALLSVLVPRLAPGALVLADNVHSHPDEIAGYLAAIKADPRFDHVVVGVGKGLSVAFWRG